MADFTPTWTDWTDPGPFRFWAQKVLPLVYDDSLSYYEVLCKVVAYLNTTIQNVAALGGNVEGLRDAYEQLQQFVNDYFDNLDVQQEINTKLDDMAETGALTTLIQPFIDIQITHDVSRWLDYNIKPTTPAIDSSLSVSGAAADAKATGDKIRNLQGIFSETPVDAQETNFAELTSTTLNPLVSLKEIDKNYKQFNGKFINSSLNFADNANYTTYVFRLPFYGFKITCGAAKIFVTNTMPTGTAGEHLDVEATVTTTGTANTTYTLNYAKGSIIVIVWNTQNLDPDNMPFKSSYIIPFTVPRLQLLPIQNEFNFYAKKDTTVDTSDANGALGIITYPGKLLAATSGNVTDNASYNTYSFQVPVDSMTITCPNGFRCTKSYYRPGVYNSNNNLIELVYDRDTSRVETFTAKYKEWVSISVNMNSYPGGLDMKTDLAHPFELPGLTLGYRQKEQFYKYVQRTYAAGTQKKLFVYFKSGNNKVVEWVLLNTPAASGNSDTWQIGGVKGYDFDGGELSNGVELALNGEFELAIKEHGAADYCGGINHGDETTDVFKLFIDGKQISDLTTLDENFHAFNRIDAFEIATINRCNTPAEDIIKHQKIWTFENGKVHVHQTCKFLEEIQVDVMMICMFKAVRPIYPYGIRQGGVEIETMTDDTFTKKYTTGNDVYYLYYGDNATAKIHAKTDNDSSVRQSVLWINNATDSNKLYLGYWGVNDSTNPVTVPANTIVTEETEYDVAYD